MQPARDVASATPACSVLGGWRDGEGSGNVTTTSRTSGATQRDWVVTWGGTLEAVDARQGLAVNAQGEIFLAHNGFIGTSPRTTALVRKLDARGDPLWTRSWQSGRGFFGEHAFAVVALPDGGAVVGGQYQREEPGCESPSSERGCTDAFITRFDGAGAERWTLTFGTGEDIDRVMGLALGDDGTLYASGQVAGPVKFAEEVLLQHHGGVDHFVLALALERCEALWARTFGTTELDLEGPAVAAFPDGVAVGPVAGSNGIVRRFARDGRELFAVSPLPTTRGVFMPSAQGDLWISAVRHGTSNAPTAELVQLGAQGTERARYTFRSPVGGLYQLWGLFNLPDGRTLVAGTYGMQALSTATEVMVHEVRALEPNGQTSVLVDYPLWHLGGGAALSQDGALLEAGTFEKTSSFGLNATEVRASKRDVYLLQRAL